MGAHGVGELLALGGRFAADLAGGIHGVLRLDGTDDFRNGDGQLGQLIGLYPKTHGVLARAENLHGADAVEARDLVAEIDVGEVREKLRIVSAIGGIESDQHERRSDGFLTVMPKLFTSAGNCDAACVVTHLSENQIGIRIGLHVEIDDQAHAAIGGGIQRIHVVHVVHAAHLLLDGRGDGLLDGACIGADVGGQHLDFGRNDVRESGRRAE